MILLFIATLGGLVATLSGLRLVMHYADRPNHWNHVDDDDSSPDKDTDECR